jgi:hypothetical protein
MLRTHAIYHQHFISETEFLEEIFNGAKEVQLPNPNNYSSTELAILVAESFATIIESRQITIKCDGKNSIRYVFEDGHHTASVFSMSRGDYAMFISLFAYCFGIPKLMAIEENFVSKIIEQTYFIQIYEEF